MGWPYPGRPIAPDLIFTGAPMSLDAEIRSTVEAAAPVDSYDRIAKAVHWTTLLVIAGVYATVWASHAAGSREQSALLVQLHRSMGLTILALTLFRLAWRWNTRIPPLPAELPLFQKFAARATEYILYVLLLLQPALGLLNTNARGRRVDFYFLGELPPVVGPDKVLAKQAMAAHELVAYLILALVALHAAAALFHHFVRRDNVLSAMLPGRRR
jgi:cytochrome b561